MIKKIIYFLLMVFVVSAGYYYYLSKLAIPNIIENIKVVKLRGYTNVGEGSRWEFSFNSRGKFSGQMFGWPMAKPDNYAETIDQPTTNAYLAKVGEIIGKYHLENNNVTEEDFKIRDNRYLISGFTDKAIEIKEDDFAFKEMTAAANLLKPQMKNPETKIFLDNILIQ